MILGSGNTILANTNSGILGHTFSHLFTLEVTALTSVNVLRIVLNESIEGRAYVDGDISIEFGDGTTQYLTTEFCINDTYLDTVIGASYAAPVYKIVAHEFQSVGYKDIVIKGRVDYIKALAFDDKTIGLITGKMLEYENVESIYFGNKNRITGVLPINNLKKLRFLQAQYVGEEQNVQGLNTLVSLERIQYFPYHTIANNSVGDFTKMFINNPLLTKIEFKYIRNCKFNVEELSDKALDYMNVYTSGAYGDIGKGLKTSEDSITDIAIGSTDIDGDMTGLRLTKLESISLGSNVNISIATVNNPNLEYFYQYTDSDYVVGDFTELGDVNRVNPIRGLSLRSPNTTLDLVALNNKPFPPVFNGVIKIVNVQLTGTVLDLKPLIATRASQGFEIATAPLFSGNVGDIASEMASSATILRDCPLISGDLFKLVSEVVLLGYMRYINVTGCGYSQNELDRAILEIWNNRTALSNTNVKSILIEGQITGAGYHNATAPDIGTFPNSIHDLTEVQVENLVLGTDYDGNGTNTPWDYSKMIWALVYMQNSSVTSTKRYFWSVSYTEL